MTIEIILKVIGMLIVFSYIGYLCFTAYTTKKASDKFMDQHIESMRMLNSGASKEELGYIKKCTNENKE